MTLPTKNNLTLRDAVRVVSLDIDVVDLGSATEQIIKAADTGNGGYVCVSNVHMVMEAYDDPTFSGKVNAADLTVPDGMPLLWMQKMQGRKDASRVRGNDLMTAIFRSAEKNGLSVGFFGGKQDVLDKMRERAATEFPGLRVAYAFSPPFRPLSEEEDVAIIDEVNGEAPDILFVGLGCPKQENWMAEHSDRLKCVLVGVGAAFDFYAGNIRECPAWLSRIGLEWLFRLTQDPKRLWRRYLILNPRFVLIALMQLLGLRRSGS